MMNASVIRIICTPAILLFFNFQFCKAPQPPKSPPGYELDKGQKFILKKHLHEISGLSLFKLNPDTVYAIEDETAKLFFFHPGDEKYPSCKFGEKGDYEDLAIWKDSVVVVLRSDGMLSFFPLSEVRDKNELTAKTIDHLLPEGEYEGLFADGDSLLVLCKNCEDDNRKQVTIHALRRNPAGEWLHSSQWILDVSAVPLTSINKKIKFHPSCFARHPLTKEWYIVSAVNNMLLVLDPGWHIKDHYPLDPSVFKQPEGLSFDSSGEYVHL